MKILSIFVFVLLLGALSFGQENNKNNFSKTEVVPEKGSDKLLYELSMKTDYKVFNSEGELIREDHGQFIDYTDYELGTYYVRYNGRVEQFKKLK